MAQERNRKKRRPEPAAPEKRQEEDNYIPAKPFNRKKLMTQLITLAAVALAVAIGLSIFFKVGEMETENGETVPMVYISGLETYSYETVLEASEIQVGDSLLFFSRAEVSSRIMQKLPYVQSVRIGISLPGTVHIEIEEVAVAYSVADRTGTWWLISADGTVLEQTNGATANSHTKIEGVVIAVPEVGTQAQAAEDREDADLAVNALDRLNAALAVAKAMEQNEIMGEFTVIDAASPYDLQLWYGADYQFCLGDSTQLELKLARIKAYLPRILQDYPAGMLDVSDPDDEAGSPFTKFE